MHRIAAAAHWRTVALLAAIAGASASAYLLVEYVTGQPGVCLTGTGCDLVRDSAFAYPLGIPTPLIGLIFYAAAGWLVVRSIGGQLIARIPAGTALVVFALLGAAGSAFLTAMEAFVIKAFCTWCLVQAGAGLVLLVASVGVARATPTDEADVQSSRTRQQVARARDAERSSLRRTARLGAGAAGLAVIGLLAIGATGGPLNVPGGTSLAPADSPRLGAGAVEVVEFADFQCPGCATLAPILASMAAADEMTLVSRYFPLDSIHSNADRSARAAEAADRQDSFWPMSEALYARQAAWKDLGSAQADAFFAQLAAEIGIDVARWEEDYASADVAAAVDADRQQSHALGLTGTPTLFIGGELYRGSLSEVGIAAAIAAVP
ncbi:MAG: vitamin K epoxide reductase family protein [Chloroflexota bacterium]